MTPSRGAAPLVFFAFFPPRLGVLAFNPVFFFPSGSAGPFPRSVEPFHCGKGAFPRSVASLLGDNAAFPREQPSRAKLQPLRATFRQPDWIVTPVAFPAGDVIVGA